MFHYPRTAVLLLCLLGSALFPAPSLATPVSSAGTILYSEKGSSGATGGAPLFDLSGALVTAGSGHPTLDSVILAQQLAGPVDIFFPPIPDLFATAVPGAIGTGTAFASATTGLTAFNAGPSAASAVLWNPMALTSAPVPGFAAVDSTAHVEVRNDLGFDEFGYALTNLGFIFQIPHTAGGYVATSLTATVNGTALAPIVLATDGVGPLPDVATGGLFAAILFLLYDPFADLDYYLAYGFSLSPLTVKSGAVLTIDATISGVADPGSSFFDVFVELDRPPLDFPIITNIGTVAVAAPSSLWLLLVGLAGAPLLRHRARRSMSSR